MIEVKRESGAAGPSRRSAQGLHADDLCILAPGAGIEIPLDFMVDSIRNAGVANVPVVLDYSRMGR